MDTSVLYTPGMSLDQLEKLAILRCYHFNQNNKTATAGSLGISIRTLDNKLARYKEDEDVYERSREDRAERSRRLLQEARGFAPVQEEASPTKDVKTSESSYISAESAENQYKPQSELPVHEREEIQDVLPRQVTNLGKPKRS